MISLEKDYSPAECKHPTYMYRPLSQQSGGNSITFTAAGTAESIFELPSIAFKLSESYIMGTATTTATATYFTWASVLAGLASNIRLYRKTGRTLAEITDMQPINALMRPLHTKSKDFITADPLELLSPIKTTGAVATPDGRLDGTAADKAYAEIKNIAAVSAGAGGTAGVADPFTWRLSAIKETIFAMTKTLVFPEVIMMRVQWGPGVRSFWLGTSQTNPATAAAPFTGLVTTSPNDLRFTAVDEQHLRIPLVPLRLRGPQRIAGRAASAEGQSYFGYSVGSGADVDVHSNHDGQRIQKSHSGRYVQNPYHQRCGH